MTPTISVLMTVYNGQRYVAQTLESILAQTRHDFEIVAVDDGSTDATAAILENFADRDERVRIVTSDNVGIPKAANLGLAECRGEFIARIDADDLAKPERLDRQLRYLVENGLVACGTWHDLIDELGRFLRVQKTPILDAVIQREALKGHGSICNPTSMFRREDFVKLGGYSEDLPVAEDLDCWLRLGEVGRLGNVPESLSAYRLHSQSISELKCQTQRDNAKIACERAWARRGITGTFEAGDMWRPGRDRQSRHRFAMEYGWWAYTSGEVKTAISYGKRAIQLKPWSPLGYKLIAATILRCRGGRPA